MGRVLNCDHACIDICHVIASELRKNLARYIIEDDRNVGFMIDESIAIHEKEAVVICLRCGRRGPADASSLD
jgi:hypothetical protein